MTEIRPASLDQLCQALADSAASGQTINTGGCFSKQAMAGPIHDAGVVISTRGLDRALEFEPRDLTISVQAGMPWRLLEELLERHSLMLPIDPPFSDQATIGGVVAANTNGPRRRLYGTVRDMVIGMKFVTQEGKVVQSGGMVVKNVAGLDMSKLLIGSFGTLAVIASVNFKLVPRTAASRTFLLRFESLPAAMRERDVILRGVLQPAAFDLLNPPMATLLGREGWTLLLEAGGTPEVLGRYSRELDGATMLEGGAESALWHAVRNITPAMLAKQPQGAVARISGTLSQVGDIMSALEVPALARAGNGVCYGYFPELGRAAEWLRLARARGWKALLEFAPPERKTGLELWPDPGSDFSLMQRIKDAFDPHHLLNRGRMYGRI